MSTPTLLPFDCFEALRFMRNFESSKRLMFELFRNYYTKDVLAFIYIIENTKLSNKVKPFDLEHLPELPPNNVPYQDEIVKYQSNPLNLNFHNQVHYSNDKYCRWPIDYEVLTSGDQQHDSLCPLTSVIAALQNSTAYAALPLCGKILLNNSATPEYRNFLQGIDSHLLPDNLRARRNDNWCGKKLRLSLVERVSIFLKSLSGTRLDCIGDPMNVIYVPFSRPKHLSKDHEYESIWPPPENYMCQPFYSGYAVTVHIHGLAMRVYNRYGELVRDGVNNAEKFISPLMPKVIFQCVILTRRGQTLRSWRVPSGHINNLIYIITDVYYYENNSFLGRPYADRFKQIEPLCGKLNLPNLFIPTKAIVTQDEATSLFEPTTDIFDGTVGMYYRSLNDIVCYKNRDLAILRKNNTGFDRKTLNLVPLDTMIRDVNQEILDILIPPPLFENCKILTIYAHDSKHYHVARYSVNIASLVHWFSFERVFSDVDDPHYNYNERRVFIANYVCKPCGIFYLRVYTENIDGVLKVVGYEHKKTDSKFDSF